MIVKKILISGAGWLLGGESYGEAN